MPETTASEKLALATVRVYVDDGSCGTIKVPLSEVVTMRSLFVLSSLILTLTPGMTAPDASMTEPVIRPTSVCACIGGVKRDEQRNKEAIVCLEFIEVIRPGLLVTDTSSLGNEVYSGVNVE